MEPGSKLRVLRKRAGLSQADAAKLIGCHQTLVGAIERGAKRPGIDVALGIERWTRGLKGGPIPVAAWRKNGAHKTSVTVEPVVREASR
jgi:DNA-binding XRE family transcriptional regulator